MDVFNLRQQLIHDYGEYATSFVQIQDQHISKYVQESFDRGAFWPDALIQLNPNFKQGASIDELVGNGTLHPECGTIFRKGKAEGYGQPLKLYQHQLEAIRVAQEGNNYVLTTGTGSGKSLAYIVPIVDHVLRRGSGRGIQAIIIYPMNALANSQYGELEKFLLHGYGAGHSPVTFAKYTGQESEEERHAIINHPPDIILTNYVMLELLLTRPDERPLIDAATGMQFLVLDELHTYRGRQGADVALLVRRVRDRLEGAHLQTVGTSATLAGEGTFDEQRSQVAAVATQLFGAPVLPEHIIGETLERATIEERATDIETLTDAAAQGSAVQPPLDYNAFVDHPLSAWIESAFGITTDTESGRLKRCEPRSISGDRGAATKLSELTAVDAQTCAAAIQRWLLAGYECAPNPDTGFPPFAFRLHQFISPGETVFASLEPEDMRYITIAGQQYVPGDRDKILLPLIFCRECGQEYYSVRLVQTEDGIVFVVPREFSDRSADDEGTPGYLYLNTEELWPTDPDEVIDKLPDDWLEEHRGSRRIRPHRRKALPRHMVLLPDGQQADTGQEIVFLGTPFMFCLNCGVSYGPRQSDYGKLATLSSEGRSSATTILSLSTILHLKEETVSAETPPKLLSFTDNRQDASLQAGHFNDFVEVGLLRGALYRAVREADEDGITHEQLAQRVFDALNLPIELYAPDPGIRFQPLQETQRALRQVLGYRLYHDLRRGWRVTSPNLEQCGLLRLDYIALREVCEAEDVWEQCHEAITGATSETRQTVAKVLLDHMRRELAIKVDYLDSRYQETIQQLSSQRLVEPWAIDEDERMAYASTLFPRPSGGDDSHGNTYVSARGGFGIYLRRPNTFPAHRDKLTLDDTAIIIVQLLEGLRYGGLVQVVAEPRSENDVPGYQLVAQSMRWLASDGTQTFHDPIRVPREPEEGGRPNPFFVHFYQEVARSLQGLEAHEHTAQVPYETREEREEQFRSGALPILYCSPTMELGVDIAELNIVNMRNVPPTPANYAQRSGRAGRSGQPALVFTYCSIGSPHDQYFFKRPNLMVAGAVVPPRLDLANEDLVRAHIHAIWLAETQINLGKTLKDVLDLSGEQPSLDLLEGIQVQVNATPPQLRTRQRATNILGMIGEDLGKANWYSDEWLDNAISSIGNRFNTTCKRWRGLYWAALAQARLQSAIILDASRSTKDKRQAEQLRRDAESQLKLLSEAENIVQSDFYSYRYFATEGFLPGYSFPRLPISAYIRARRTRQRDEFLSRPRFLAISEFGPRAIIYHEGSRYIINQVILPVDDEGTRTRQAAQCEACGYLHPITDSDTWDLCERCGTPLPPPLQSLLRLQNVMTLRRDRINSDEEERLRLGYDIRTGIRFPEREGYPSHQVAAVMQAEDRLAQLVYAQAATLWRINLGWARRKNKNQHGFVLDIERGYWARSEQAEENDPEDPMSPQTQRVIPYVEDSRNCLLFEPSIVLEEAEITSLQAALKRAIETRFQLESNELAAEPLPNPGNRRSILFYEAAEGGAGVLRTLIEEPYALAAVAREALLLCHYDPDTMEDKRRAEGAREDCEAACYNCLLSYSNQREHSLLDRQSIVKMLAALAQAEVVGSPTASPREDHLGMLMRLAGSDLERQWLDFLDIKGYRLPDDAQVLFEACQTRPDFIYSSDFAVIYIDGSPHDYPNRQARDAEQTSCMEDMGYTVIRFGYRDDWEAIISQYLYVFGG
ncbi:MAG: DEAD/DEAH box helicase [Anaerolineae bacterium]|nr:DEAD/DEAH box helicase [Anaerolineae bacterium]